MRWNTRETFLHVTCNGCVNSVNSNFNENGMYLRFCSVLFYYQFPHQ